MPAVNTTFPLKPELATVPDPPDKIILPACPLAAVPELILTRPVVPKLDVPVLKVRAPLIPEVPAFAEAIKIEPDVDLIGAPLNRYKEAPVA